MRGEKTKQNTETILKKLSQCVNSGIDCQSVETAVDMVADLHRTTAVPARKCSSPWLRGGRPHAYTPVVDRDRKETSVLNSISGLQPTADDTAVGATWMTQTQRLLSAHTCGSVRVCHLAARSGWKSTRCCSIQRGQRPLRYQGFPA